ncbi:uncharacterized protein LOC143184124 isoform X1 [Calliopsis andreniformis]|uniref:uncharacterized protein LOC143184124 isoform X1 n=1 Tax=Calliopsis andreniformis TaxID=337506 RepID=UPI003FCE1FED
MGTVVGLFMLTFLCSSFGGVRGACRHVENDDMIEYACVGGHPSDLDDLPASTGKIRISNMPISRITAETFSRFGSELWVLGCSHCGIVDIEPGAFQRLINLQQLSLDNNHLATVKESWFRGLDYLTYLDLNYNRIETIEDGVFKNLPSLVDLRLSGNRLECVNLEAMSHLRDLKRMFLTENPEFKCPNAVSTFLENHGVNFEKDPEWNRIPEDLIAVEPPFEYYSEYDDTTPTPTTTLPTYRERLHLTSMTPPTPVETTSPYVPPKLYTTEEVVYEREYLTPDWRTIPRPTVAPEQREQTTTSRSSYDEDRRTYVPPGTIAPLDPMTHSSYDTTPFNRVDDTTLRSWPRFPESTSARPKFPLYPPHENEDKRYEQPYYPSEATDPFSLAPVPNNRYETPPFVESNMEHTTVPYRVDWSETNTVSLDSRYPSIDDDQPPEYRVPLTNTFNVEPIRPLPPEMIQPASPDNVYQPPYYEHTITVHSPSLESNQSREEEVTPGVTSIETTTDKPLPNCSHRNLSSLTERSVGIIFLSILVVMMNVLVEGF